MPNRSAVVLLGASNLARGFAAAVAVCGRVRPQRLLMAGGRGRAYSRASALLVRGLPSISGCGLWRQLDRLASESAAHGNVHALVTDLGNDLVYGASVDETMQAVVEAVARLQRVGANVVITPPPLSSLERFPIVWLDTVRRSFFPGSTLSASVILERVYALDQKLRGLAAELDLRLVEQAPEWYGLDPIHHRPSRQFAAFSAMTESWGGEPRRAGLNLRRRLALAWPEESWLCGRPVRRAQPSVRLGDCELMLY